jgi:hypothetical protein
MPAESVACLTCGKHVAAHRGCCSTCYRRHCLAVRAGQTTWAKLEAAGLAVPAAPVGWAFRRYPDPSPPRGTP